MQPRPPRSTSFCVANTAGSRSPSWTTPSPLASRDLPLHHHAFDETFYVIEGELTFQLEDEYFTRKAGELAFAPRNVPHTFANLSGADARTLIICTPAGFERYFDRMAAERAGVDPPAEATEPLPEVTTVGPRIGERPGG